LLVLRPFSFHVRRAHMASKISGLAWKTATSSIDYQSISFQTWRLYWPVALKLKLNFDGAAQGNPEPAGYGGVARDHKGHVMGVYWGDLGESSNNFAELEGLVHGLCWANINGWSSLLVEGDSRLIIDLATRLQAGSSTSKVSRNWRWESRVEALSHILHSAPAITFMHVRRKGNKVADAVANKGVGAGTSFQEILMQDWIINARLNYSTWTRATYEPLISFFKFLRSHSSLNAKIHTLNDIEIF